MPLLFNSTFKNFRTYVKWAFGLGFLLVGIFVAMPISFFGGLPFAICGLIIIPTTWKWIENQFSLNLSREKKFFTVIGLFFLGAVLTSAEQVDSEPKIKEQKSVDYYNLPQEEKDRLNHIDVQQAEQVAKESATDRHELVEKQFSVYDGSHRGLEKYIKKNMNDPDSYEHVETRFTDVGDYILVVTKFRGANAFGAKVINTVTAKVDFNGNVLEIISQD